MKQRQNSQQRFRTWVWVLSLLLFLSPLLSQAHWLKSTPAGDAVVEMPCHQASSGMQDHPSCKHCNKVHGFLVCDCCQSTMPPSLTMAHPILIQVPSHSELQTQTYILNVPEPPPGFLYRPPIYLI